MASHAGIHIIKVNSRRPDIGQIKVRHILKLTQGADSSGIASRRAAIDSIARLLAAGADFASIAKAETDDPSGRAKGGALPWFGAGMMVPQFEAAAFSLAPGEMSAVVETPYGFHIILCDDRRPSLPDDEIASQVDAAMEADGRTDMARRRFMDRFIASHPDLADASPDRLAAAATELLPSLSPDFRNLISEYRDGMLLYEISNRMVWAAPPTTPPASTISLKPTATDILLTLLNSKAILFKPLPTRWLPPHTNGSRPGPTPFSPPTMAGR